MGAVSEALGDGKETPFPELAGIGRWTAKVDRAGRSHSRRRRQHGSLALASSDQRRHASRGTADPSRGWGLRREGSVRVAMADTVGPKDDFVNRIYREWHPNNCSAE